MEIFEASEILKMEAPELVPVIRIENTEKCRMCQKNIKNRIIITNAIRKKFLDVTQTELQQTDKLSKFICYSCDKNLKEAYVYRENLIETERKLWDEIGETLFVHSFEPEIVNLKQEEQEVAVVDEDLIDDDFGHTDFDKDDDDDYFTPFSSANKKDVENKFKIIDDSPKITQKKEQDHKSNENKRRRQRTTEDPPFGIDVEQRAVKDENGKTFYVCDVCGKNITTAFSLREHILTQHTELERKYTCNREGCGRSYVTHSRLRIHQQTHKDDKKVVCSECGAMLYSKKGLREHIASVHTKVMKYFCDKCEYSGTLKARIRSHVRVHIERHNRTKHACHICGFVSICPKSLKRHLYEHQGIVYECHCGKSFNYKGALQMHVRCVHKKIKKHVCLICDKAFFNKTDLANHTLLKHNADKVVKNIPCEVCGKLYALEKQLERHRLYHHLRYNCDYEGCDEYFNTEKRLERHKKKHEMS